MVDAEAQLKSAVRAYAASARAITHAARARDEAIRKARAGGVSQERVMELTGLSRPRVNQIVREETGDSPISIANRVGNINRRRAV